MGTRFGGRKKGTPNKVTSDVREMIREALRRKGGAAYLERMADENPNAFASLVGRIIPKEVEAQVDTEITIRWAKDDA